nr:leporins efflux protein lepc [Quercus suber]
MLGSCIVAAMTTDSKSLQMMLSLCQEYWQVFLAQGLVVGFGGGMLYIPAIALVTTQFTTKRPIAVGLASSGSSIGRFASFSPHTSS